jgi:hypothetical protein
MGMEHLWSTAGSAAGMVGGTLPRAGPPAPGAGPWAAPELERSAGAPLQNSCSGILEGGGSSGKEGGCAMAGALLSAACCCAGGQHL